MTLVRRTHVSPLDSLTAEMKSKMTPGLLTCINLCGILYFLIVTLVIVSVSFTVTLPALYDGVALWSRILIALLILFQIAGNFVLVWRCNSYCDQDVSNGWTLPSGGWTHCSDCGIFVPPRSHHCPLCRHCVAVRDHHCFFTASCVGRDNRRHFIAFCVDCAIGTAYAVHVAYRYVRAFHDDGSYTYVLLPVALVRWLFGSQSASSVLFVAFTYLCGMTFAGSCGITVWQVFLVLRGQTSHEYQSGKWVGSVPFSARAFLRNVRAVFGPYWPVVFLCPYRIFPVYNDDECFKSV